MTLTPDHLDTIFSATRRAMDPAAWESAASQCATPSDVPELLAAMRDSDTAPIPPYLPDLSRLEYALHRAASAVRDAPDDGEGPLRPAPGVDLVHVPWRGLPALAMARPEDPAPPPPLPGETLVLVWPSPDGVGGRDGGRCAPADEDSLLALKIVTEELDIAVVARETDVPPGAVWDLLRRKRDSGLLHGALPDPDQHLARDPEYFPRPEPGDADAPRFPQHLFAAETFTLQWHITQACDMHCRHCYDRTSRNHVDRDVGLRIIGELAEFCRSRGVHGQISFIGGNPLLHPDFFDFYQAAADAGLGAVILGNPCPPETLDAILAIAKPAYYQISMEGLEEHNDYIRGPGHFQRALAFLDLLRDRGVTSYVMLTLTRANQDQALPLARLLKGRVGRITFNRLALMGEGADLACADIEGYEAFIAAYLDESRGQDHMRLKDNLFNLKLHEWGEPLTGGCTGHGCGAAFNFMALLSDGETHACRKLDSPIGNVHEQGFAAIYDGHAARAYRRGSEACRGCALRPACGGCLAVGAGFGANPLQDRDPYCWAPQSR